MNCLPIFIVLAVFCVSVLGQGRDHMKCLEVVDKDFFEYKKKNPNDTVVGGMSYKKMNTEKRQCVVTCGLEVSKKDKQGKYQSEFIEKNTVLVPDYLNYPNCGKSDEQKYCINGKCVNLKETQMYKFCAEKLKKELKENKNLEIFFGQSGCNYVTCNYKRFPTPTFNFTDYQYCNSVGPDKYGRSAFCKQGKCVMPDGKRPTYREEE